MVKLLIFFCLTITLCWAGPSHIVRPCKLNDYKCIGANLAANSNCNKNVRGSVPSQFHVDRFRMENPYFNSSIIETDLTVRNLNKCYVSEFFFNLKTDKAVLGINCPNFGVEGDRKLIRHQSLKEDTYYYYHARAIYPLIRLTLNLYASTRLNVCRAHVFTDVTALPKTKNTPKDKATANFLSKDLSKQHIFERESCYYRGFPIARIFIDNYLCDYNCYPFILD